MRKELQVLLGGFMSVTFAVVMPSNVQAALRLSCSKQTLTFTDVKAPEQAERAVRKRVGLVISETRCRPVIKRKGFVITVRLPLLTSAEVAQLTAPGPLEFRAVLKELGPKQASSTTAGAQELVAKYKQNAYLLGPILLGGTSVVEEATANVAPETGAWQIDVLLTEGASPTFDRIAKDNRGKKLAIVVSGSVVMAPLINASSFGGNLAISGNFSADEAKEIAAFLGSAYPSTTKSN
jgi:preprotein translocase subunit SecD